MEPGFIKCELRAIDAWRYDGQWVYNSAYTIEDDLYFTPEALNTRNILKVLRGWNYLSAASKGKLTVWTDGDIYEVQNRKTGEPLLVLIPS